MVNYLGYFLGAREILLMDYDSLTLLDGTSKNTADFSAVNCFLCNSFIQVSQKIGQCRVSLQTSEAAFQALCLEMTACDCTVAVTGDSMTSV